MSRITFAENAWEEYLYWQTQDKKTSVCKMLRQYAEHIVLRMYPGKQSSVFQLAEPKKTKKMMCFIASASGKLKHTGHVRIAQILKHPGALLHGKPQNHGLIYGFGLAYVFLLLPHKRPYLMNLKIRRASH